MRNATFNSLIIVSRHLLTIWELTTALEWRTWYMLWWCHSPKNSLLSVRRPNWIRFQSAGVWIESACVQHSMHGWLEKKNLPSFCRIVRVWCYISALWLLKKRTCINSDSICLIFTHSCQSKNRLFRSLDEIGRPKAIACNCWTMYQSGRLEVSSSP